MKYLFPLFLLLTGCQIIGTTYTVGSKDGSDLMDERTLADDWKDTQINIALRTKLMSEKFAYVLDVEITVFESEVMLNGAIPTIEDMERIVEIAWKTEGVSKVYNHIRLENPAQITDTSEDAFIAASIRTQLALTQNVSSVNYKITVDDNVLYVMGIAKNQAEFDAVMNAIKSTKGVKKVISHVRKSYEQQ